jgi:tetratricopeptide (TPR) repeat protein
VHGQHDGANRALRALLAEAGWGGADLVRAVNAAGREVGAELRYQRSSAAQWLAGVQPRPPAPDLIVEVLGRRLGRLIVPAEAGLRGSGRGGNGGGGGVARVRHALSAFEWQQSAELALAQDADDDGSGGVFVARELDVPWFGQSAFTAPRGDELGIGRGRGQERRRTVTQRDVLGAESVLSAYSRSDHAFGGGHSRHALAQHLSHTISPLLGVPAPADVRRDLLVVAAKMAYLCGFMHFDDSLNSTAQQYYRISLRLADEADDRVGYATALRGLSVQAESLGHHTLSAQLAQAAIDVGWHAAPVPVRAFLSGQLAVATAAIGEHVASLGHFRRTERLLDRASSNTDAVGAFHEASLEYQYATLAVYQGAPMVAIDAFKRSLRARPDEERRSRALTLARTAELFLDCGHLESACEQWHRFLDDYRGLASRRVDEALGTMRARLMPFSRNSDVAALLHRTAETRDAQPSQSSDS